MRMLRRLIGILVLVMVVLAMVQMVGAETAQTWYFTPTSYTGTPANGIDHHKDNIMSKTGPTTTPKSTYFKSPDVVWFYAENAAQCGLSFGEYDWTAYIAHDEMKEASGNIGDTITVDIYKVAEDGTATHIASGSKTFTGGDMWEV